MGWEGIGSVTTLVENLFVAVGGVDDGVDGRVVCVLCVSREGGGLGVCDGRWEGGKGGDTDIGPEIHSLEHLDAEVLLHFAYDFHGVGGDEVGVLSSC